MGWNKGPAGGLCGGSDLGIGPYFYVRFAIFLFIGEISTLLENFNFDTEWGKIKVPKWGNWATLGPKRPHVGAADKTIFEVTGLYNIFKGSKLLIKMGWNLLSVAPGLLVFYELHISKNINQNAIIFPKKFLARKPVWSLLSKT